MMLDGDGLPLYRYARLIGFGHKARQGKDLAVKLLAEVFPGRVSRVAFADALRVVCRVQHGMTEKDAPLLQRVGVEARASDQLVWVRAVAWAIWELDAEADAPFIVCIPDTRFQNEAAFVRARGLTCRLERFTAEGARVIAADRPADHPSEVDLDGYDWQHTVRASTREELRRGVIAVASALLPSITNEQRPTYDERRANLRPCKCGAIFTHPHLCDANDRCMAADHPHHRPLTLAEQRSRNP